MEIWIRNQQAFFGTTVTEKCRCFEMISTCQNPSANIRKWHQHLPVPPKIKFYQDSISRYFRCSPSPAISGKNQDTSYNVHLLRDSSEPGSFLSLHDTTSASQSLCPQGLGPLDDGDVQQWKSEITGIFHEASKIQLEHGRFQQGLTTCLWVEEATSSSIEARNYYLAGKTGMLYPFIFNGFPFLFSHENIGNCPE